MSETVYCQKPGCGRSWSRDPALEVPCPDCRVGIGVNCRRPSGHCNFGKCNVHSSRDLRADALGHYGTCPSGRCGQARIAAEPKQIDLFASVAS